VGESPGCPALLQKSALVLIFLTVLLFEHFECHGAVDFRIKGLVNLRHGPFADRLTDLVSTDRFTNNIHC